MAANGPIRQSVTVANPPLGLHLRPANAIAKLVRRSKCAVTVSLGDKSADGRSPSDLLMLFAPPGTVLLVEGSGDGVEETVAAVVAILTDPGEPDEPLTSS
jgi:phosphotransferase system HPr (HPr) family protein